MNQVPAIVAAGDGKAAKAIHGESKVYLEVAGRPMVVQVVVALQGVPEISEVWVVGNAERLEGVFATDAVLSELTKPLYIVPQYGNLLANAWQTFRRMLPGAGPAGRDPEDDAERERSVLYVSADLPFAVPEELSAFLAAATAADCDYALGLSTEESMTPFYPEDGQDGIEMAYFNTAEGRVRQNNLHLVKPARLGNRQAVEDMYEHRYQKELGQMLGLAYRILTNEGGGPRIVFYYGLMHLALRFDRAGMRGVADRIRRAVPLAKIERACSSLLEARFRLVVTEIGGSAIDIDNEHDLEVARARYDDWCEVLRGQVEQLGLARVLPEEAGPPAAVEVIETAPEGDLE